MLCIACALMFCACKEESITFAEPTIEVSKKGAISQTIVESFDKEYYNVNELRSEIESAISDFESNGHKDEVKLTDVHTNEGKVFVSFSFASSEVDSAFQDDEIYYGTINDAYDNGYSLDVTLKSVNDDTKIGKAEIMDMKKNHILIVSSHGIVKTEYKIQYVSANVEVIDEKTVRISSDSDGLAYIVMK